MDEDSALAVISEILGRPVTLGLELGDLGIGQFEINELASDLEETLNIRITDTSNWRIINNVVESIT